MPDPFASEADFPQQQIPPQPLADEQSKPPAEHLPDWERLRSDAIQEASHWKISRHRRSIRTFEKAAHETAEIIAAALAMARKSSLRSAESAQAQWLPENQRPLASALEQTRGAVNACRDLPQLEPEDNPNESVPRVYRAAAAFLRSTDYNFDEQSFSVYFAAMQESSPFTMNELWTLRSMLLLALLEKISERLRGPSARKPSLPHAAVCSSDVPTEVLTSSLQRVVEARGAESVEEMSLTERVLKEDPADIYRQMDSESRNRYRSVVSELARHSTRSEVDIARAAVALSGLAKTEWNSEPRRAERHRHVGYYLVDGGRTVLEHQIDYRPPLMDQIREAIRRKPDAFYLVSIEFLTFAIMAFVLNGLRAQVPLIWALVLLLIPTTESAIGAMNQLVAALIPPRPLPKLDFSKGIPAEFATIVAVPTLLTSESQVQQTVRDLELRYLGNRDSHLHFALLTDFPDSPQPPRERGTLVDLCSRLIEGLNDRYRARGAGLFFLFHRDLVYNPVESTWMGWERKRGKLLDFNNLLRGRFDSFPVKVGDLSVLPTVRYVITLDADTQLPRDSARRLVGALAHPLNRAVVDPATNTVVEGYGILQPRIGISVRSANRSRLASIYSGQAGFDSYTRAVSDVYQDLMDEGSFTGKGIYEVDVFQRVLSDRFPLNTILSHDLIEGAYARAGLVSDIELVDDYPSHFSAFSRRKHRWVRGDWQIMRWLLPRVPDHSGRLVKNPISVISKWKILDNLRRSLVEPATFMLLLAGWFSLPGGPARWTLAVLALLLIPAYSRLIVALVNLPRAAYFRGYLSDIADSFVTDQVNVFMLLAFLAHQVLVTLDAIVRTVVRLTITRRRLLEWETAAEAEAGAGRRTPVDLYLELTPDFGHLGLVRSSLALAEPPVAAGQK
jgi:cyclic beta-1,2-glucan synthetase